MKYGFKSENSTQACALFGSNPVLYFQIMCCIRGVYAKLFVSKFCLIGGQIRRTTVILVLSVWDQWKPAAAMATACRAFTLEVVDHSQNMQLIHLQTTEGFCAGNDVFPPSA